MTAKCQSTGSSFLREFMIKRIAGNSPAVRFVSQVFYGIVQAFNAPIGDRMRHGGECGEQFEADASKQLDKIAKWSDCL